VFWCCSHRRLQNRYEQLCQVRHRNCTSALWLETWPCICVTTKYPFALYLPLFSPSDIQVQTGWAPYLGSSAIWSRQQETRYWSGIACSTSSAQRQRRLQLVTESRRAIAPAPLVSIEFCVRVTRASAPDHLFIPTEEVAALMAIVSPGELTACYQLGRGPDCMLARGVQPVSALQSAVVRQPGYKSGGLVVTPFRVQHAPGAGIPRHDLDRVTSNRGL
jgi:hypothetical protein